MVATAFAKDAQRFRIQAERIEELSIAAIQAKEGAYCRYSNFRVGAALLTSTGEILTGANVENASYPVGICAERCAMAKAVADGHRKFHAIAVAADSSNPTSPCGMCRQFMSEFCEPGIPIFMIPEQDGEKGHSWSQGSFELKDPKFIVMTMGDLLPESFGPESR